MFEQRLYSDYYIRGTKMISFGTGGWRAEIGKDFTEDNIRSVAQGLADRISERKENDKPVIIGYDRRFLSVEAAGWIAEVLAGNGISVCFLHRSVPTPLIMHTVKKQKMHYGIEVTASHNPSNYNGIKIIIEEGRDAPVEVTDDIAKRANAAEIINAVSFKEAVSKGLIAYIENPFNDFLDDILAALDTDAIRNRGLRILFDSMHGSASYPFNVVFYTTRCTIDQINANKDAFFGGDMPAPTQDTLYLLKERVKKEGYDLGLGVDGDGDRLGVIDRNGEYISANDILCLLYYYLHEYKGWKGPVVRNLSTTHMLDRIARDLGEECCEVPVGFKYISEKIDEVDAVLGGESSGGLTVRGHIHGKDSIYAAALFVEMICKTGKTPTELLNMLHEKYGKTEFVECNLKLEKDVDLSEIDIPDFPDDKVVRVNKQDGTKVYFADDSFVICRHSGTEPLLRIFAEAPSREKAEYYIEQWKKYIAG